MSWFARAAEIGRNHETNLNSRKKLAKRRNRIVDVVSKEKTRSRHKRSNNCKNKEDFEKKASKGKERQDKKNKHRR